MLKSPEVLGTIGLIQHRYRLPMNQHRPSFKVTSAPTEVGQRVMNGDYKTDSQSHQ